MNARRLPFVLALTTFAGCSTAMTPSLPPAGAAQAARAAAPPRAAVWAQSDGYKIRPSDKPVLKNTSASISGAQNETVSFQIVVTAKSAVGGVDVAVSDFSDGKGHTIPAASSVELFREYYVDLTHPSGSTGSTGMWPDGLVPIGADPYYHERRNGAPFDVGAGQNQAVWADVAIPVRAVPGTYNAIATVTAGSSTLARMPVKLIVWNFAIPSTSALTTAFGFNSFLAYQGTYGSKAPWSTPKITTLTNLYQAEALKNGISFYGGDVEDPVFNYDAATGKITSINYQLYDATQVPAMDGTLLPNAAQMNVAQIPDADEGNPAPPLPGATPGPQDAENAAFWNVMGAYFTQKGWMTRNFYYDLDEPQTPADYETVAHRADVVHQGDASIRVMDTTAYHADLVGKVNVWTPIVNELDSPGFPPPSQYTQRQKAGDTVWFYHSNESLSGGGPWPNFFIDQPTTNASRIFGWMARRYGLTGFLYYSTVLDYNRPPGTPWTNVYQFGDNGDGTLFYPGSPSYIGGRDPIPCPSIRLKAIRDALSNYAYMAILDSKGQRAFVDSIVERVAAKTNHWTTDPAALDAARAEMAAKISRLSP